MAEPDIVMLNDRRQEEEEEDEFEIDTEAKEWMAEKAELELKRLKEAKVMPVLLQAKNYGIVLGESHAGKSIIINRAELCSGFDFEGRVKQILVSPSEPYPNRPDFAFCHVILLTENMTIPMVIPYLYPTKMTAPPTPPASERGVMKMIKNDLKHWLFINSSGARARHSIEGDFHDI